MLSELRQVVLGKSPKLGIEQRLDVRGAFSRRNQVSKTSLCETDVNGWSCAEVCAGTGVVQPVSESTAQNLRSCAYFATPGGGERQRRRWRVGPRSIRPAAAASSLGTRARASARRGEGGVASG